MGRSKKGRSKKKPADVKQGDEAVAGVDCMPSSVTRVAPPPAALPPWYESRDVLHSILPKFLGLSDLLQCRLVCKAWHETLGSIQHIRSRFCCHTDEKLDCAFWLRPEHISMHVCPTAIRMPTTSQTCWTSSLDVRVPASSILCELVASAHGLLCFTLTREYPYNNLGPPLLVICNPATGAHRILPEFGHIKELESVGMRWDPTENTYTIFATGKNNGVYYHDDGSPVKKPYYVSHVEIYHSSSGLWLHHSHCLTDEGVEKGRIAWWQGRFHCIVKHPEGSLDLLAYEMSKGTWIETQVLGIPCIDLPSLFVWKGSLVCKHRYSHYKLGSKLWQVQALSSNQQTSGPSIVKSVRKPTTLHVAAHFSSRVKLQVCIYDPFSAAPTKSPYLSSHKYIVRTKREDKCKCFTFTPCFSAQV